MPVPKAFEMASFAANRAARNGAGALIRQAIADLVRMQNAVQEPLAEPLVRGLNPRHLDDVNANAQNHAEG